MTFLGLDTAAAHRHTGDIRTAATRSRTVREHLAALVGGLTWTGPDASLFREQFSSTCTDWQNAEDLLVRRFAEEMQAHAEEQDLASSSDGSRGAEGTTTGHESHPPATAAELSRRGGDDSGQMRDSRTRTPDAKDLDESRPSDDLLAKYEEGPPERPELDFDDHFPYKSKEGEATWSDHMAWSEWAAKLNGARLLRPDLDDALDLYAHYRDGSGEPRVVDYEEGYREDPAIRSSIDKKIQEAQAGAQRMLEEGRTDFSFTGPPTPSKPYPETENWQKTLGDHQQWNSGDVTVDSDGNARMVVTVHGEDMYNFNRGQSDIASGTPDDENGRFSELGWAQGFEVSGTVTRVVTWNVNDPSSMTVTYE